METHGLDFRGGRSRTGRPVLVPKPIPWEGWELAGCFKVSLNPQPSPRVAGGWRTQGGFGPELTWSPWSSPMGNICVFVLAPRVSVVLKFSSNADTGALLFLVVLGGPSLLLWSSWWCGFSFQELFGLCGTRTLYLSSTLSWSLPIALDFPWGTKESWSVTHPPS